MKKNIELTDYEKKLRVELQKDFDDYHNGKLKVISRAEMDEYIRDLLVKLKQKKRLSNNTVRHPELGSGSS
jgi:hypothetical protein